MKKIILSLSITVFTFSINAQENLTPEGLLQLGKVSGLGVTKDGKSVVYSVRTYNLAENKKTTQIFVQPII
ncbi:MAG: S9 family peptidase, partial [Bacteroidia bacterium]